MEYRRLELALRDENAATTVPPVLANYLGALSTALPLTEFFLADPEYDIRTLHSNICARDAIVRADTSQGANQVSTLWDTAELHELDPTGTRWIKTMGTGLRYEVKDMTSSSTTKFFVSIKFWRVV